MDSCPIEEIEKVKTTLKYPVKLIEDNKKDFLWDFKNSIKSHVITHPSPVNEKFFHLNLLHEFIHGLHYERFSKAFSKNNFIIEYKDDPLVELKIPDYFNCARDWFVNAHIYRKCFKEMSLWNQTDYNKCSKYINELGDKTLNERQMLSAGLIFAEADKWQNLTPPNYQNLQQVVEAYISVSPETPSLKKLESLIKSLFSSIGSFIAKMALEDGLPKWTIYKA